MLVRITSLFPLWALSISFVAYAQPGLFTGFKPMIVPLLGIVMLSMGMTLTWGSFAQVLRRPATIGLGVVLQYVVMPFLAWAIALVLGLPPHLMAGLVLLGACPGGTASNVVCYLARGDVALSIALTTVSTLLAILATPLLTWLYVGERVPVPVQSMLWSIFKIVLLPVSVGVLANSLAGRYLRPIKQVFPLLSVAAIVFIIAIVVALNRDNLETMGWVVALAVLLHNAGGLTAGYALARLLGWDERTARTLAIEVGMQNSGLAVALAAKYFAPVAALPGALFSIWHNLTGALLASFLARRSTGETESRNRV